MKRNLFLIVSLLFVCFSCKQEEPEPLPIAVGAVELNKTSLTLKCGESAVLVATIHPDDAENQGLSWYSTDDAIVTVNNGKVTAISAGEASIIVETDDGGYAAECMVTVEDNDDEVVEVERVTLNKESVTMVVGDEINLSATVEPSNATNKNVSWSTSSSSVASVSNGKVKAISSGTAKITVITEDGGCTAVCTVTVTQSAGPSWGICGTFNDWGQNGHKDVVMLDTSYENYYVSTDVSLTNNSEFKFRYDNKWDENYGLATKISPVSTNTKYTLSQGGENILMVNGGTYDIFLSKSFGHCYIMTKGSKPQDAVKPGEQAGPSWGICGTINNWGQDGDKDIVMTQSSNENYYVATSVSLTSSDEFKFRYNNDWGKNYGGEDKYSIFSPNTKYSTVSDGKNIKVAKAGTYDVYLSKSYDTFYIMDEKKSPEDNGNTEVRVENIKLNESSLSMYVGDEYQLVAEISPSNATNKEVIWESSNAAVAYVTDGKVKANKEGSTEITATTKDGGKVATCSVTVTENKVSVTGITLSESEVSMYVGDEYQLVAEISPSNATNKEVIWESSNAAVASVTDGKVKANKEGSARITVKTQDGGYWAYCEVYVSAKEEPVEFDFTVSGSVDGYDYVDLGLSVKWATHNIGANTMTEVGEYYAWGELTPYNKQLTYRNYGWSYPPCSPDAVLSSIYDTATELWGRSWRMPTSDEQKELIQNCEWTWVDNINNTSMSGYVATSKKNGKSIFLPATQFISGTDSYTPKENDAIYWSASAYSVAGSLSFGSGGDTAKSLNFVSIGGMKDPVEISSWQMGSGATIRPVVGTPNDYYPDPRDLTHDEEETQRQGYNVSGKKGGYTYVDLGLPSRTLWATYNIGAEMPTDYGSYFAWGETAPKDLYVDENYVFFSGYSDEKESYSQFTKYILNKEHGKPDGKDMLDNQDDAAYVNWGSDWNMPTIEQITELGELCDFWRKDVYVNGKQIIGYVGKSKLNGNRIYLPCAGWEYSDVPNNHMFAWYWSAELSQKLGSRAMFMMYDSEASIIRYEDGTSRWQGLPVRAVTK